MPQPLIENHPYFSEVLAGFHDRMNELGHPPAIVRTLDEVSDAEQIRNLVKENGIRGVVIISWYDQALIEQLEREKVAVLGVSLNDERLTVPVVDCDRIFSARTAVRHLIDQGHRRIGFIGGPAYSRKMDNDERFIGYKFAMMEAGLSMPEDWIINTNWNVDLSYSMLTELLVNLAEKRMADGHVLRERHAGHPGDARRRGAKSANSPRHRFCRNGRHLVCTVHESAPDLRPRP